MAKLVYTSIQSVDGFVEDVDGSFSWAAPDEEVFAFVNELEGRAGTYLYGRRMYETMRYWETAGPAGLSGVESDFARLWRAADKVVYSTTLSGVDGTRTRLERVFDPDGVRALKEAVERDVTVGGATLAARALDAGLVDECHLLVVPVVVGGGKPGLAPRHAVFLDLVDHRRFSAGTVHLHYRVRG